MGKNGLLLVVLAILAFIFFSKKKTTPPTTTTVAVKDTKSGVGALLANPDVDKAIANGLNSLWDNIWS